jgi:hypothetical protein
MFSYRSILKQALSLSWKNKYLWFFGLFASLTIAGGSIEYQFINQSFGQGILNSSYQGLDELLGIAGIFQFIYLGIVELFSQNLIVIINALSIILLAATLIAVIAWLAISSQAAIVDTVKRIVIPSKKKSTELSIRHGLSEGQKHFWPVLGLNIFMRILISAAFFISSLPLLFMMISNAYALVVVYTILFTIFVPVAVSLSLIVKYAISYNVLEGESLVNSLEKGFTLFKKNWLISLEVALLLFLISLFASFFLLLAMAIVVLPIFVTGLFLSATWLAYLAIFIALLIIIIFGSFLTTFQITSWTNLYLHIKAGKGAAKLERVFRKK